MSFANSDFGIISQRADMKSAPTTEIPNQYYEERTVPCHEPKAWVRRQDAAFWQIFSQPFKKMSYAKRQPEILVKSGRI